MAASVQVSYLFAALLALEVEVFPQNPPTKTVNAQGRNAQTDAATILDQGSLSPQSREALYPWLPLQIGAISALSPLGKAYDRLQPSR